MTADFSSEKNGGQKKRNIFKGLKHLHTYSMVYLKFYVQQKKKKNFLKLRGMKRQHEGGSGGDGAAL